MAPPFLAVEHLGVDRQRVRVGAAQFAVESIVGANLQRCLAAIDGALAANVRALVLPEFCNHPPVYDDLDHAREMAVDLLGPFVTAIAERVRGRNLFVQCNVSRRDLDDGSALLFASNLLIGPAGIVAVSDKSFLFGEENLYFARGRHPNPVIDLPFGRVGMYASTESLICEPTRQLAIRGARLLLGSLCPRDGQRGGASNITAVRAAENGVFIVTACATEPVAVAQRDAVESVSLVVGPGGDVVAIGPTHGDALVVADIDLREAAEFVRPDGTDVFRSRRPEAYLALGDMRADDISLTTTNELSVAVVIPSPGGSLSIAGDVRSALLEGARLVVLPELAGRDPYSAEHYDWPDLVQALIRTLTSSRIPTSHVVTSVVEHGQHVGIVVGRDGIVHRQPQIHQSRRLSWMDRPGSSLTTVDLPWGRLGLAVGDDLAYPETTRVLTIAGSHVIACPASFQQPWEVRYGLVARAAENRVNLIAASAVYAHSRIGESSDEAATGGFAGIIAAVGPLRRDRTAQTFRNLGIDCVWAPVSAGVTLGIVRPVDALDKTIEYETDLVHGRPRSICAPLVDLSLPRIERP